MDQRPADAGAGQGADAVLLAHQGERTTRRSATVDGAAHQLVQQHDLRRRRRQHRLLPRQLHPEARHRSSTGRSPVDGSDPATEWQGVHSRRRAPERAQPAERLALQHEQLAVVGGRAGQPERSRLSRATWTRSARTRAASTPCGCSSRQEGLHAGLAASPRLRQLPDRRSTHCCRRWSRPTTRCRRATRSRRSSPSRSRCCASWDCRWSATSVPTSLAVFWGDELVRRGRARDAAGERTSYVHAPSSATPRATARGAGRGRRQARPPTSATWQTPWGDINRFQRLTRRHRAALRRRRARASRSAFTVGALGLAGVVRRARPTRHRRRWYGTSGNSFVAVVEFGDSVRARAVTAGGESGDPRHRTSTTRPSATQAAICATSTSTLTS